MNNYIEINNKKYKTLGSNWTPQSMMPSQVRPTWNGRLDVVYAPTVIQNYVGVIIVPVTPATGFGYLSDFRTAYQTKAAQTFKDHYGNQFTIVFTGILPEKSIMNTWDAASNEFNIPVMFYAIPVI